MKPWGYQKITKKRKRLLKYWRQYPDKPMIELCKGAKVSQKVYYALLESPEFSELLVDECKTMADTNTLAIFASLCERALKGNIKAQEIFFKIRGFLPAGSINETRVLNIVNQSGEEPLLTSPQIRGLLGWK